MKTVNIAIDGPSGAGKSSLAKVVAAKLGYVYVDTGALYRTIGLYVFRAGIDPADTDAVIGALGGIDVSLEYENGTQHVILNGEDVGSDIRLPEISMYASAVSAVPKVREFLLSLQRNMAKTHNVIMDGRDIGTVILPHADVKIFLFASPEARARRRYAELVQKGVKTTLEEVLSDMETRDKNDSTRKTAPAVPASDAIMLDNSDMAFDETVDTVLRIIGEKTK